MSSAAESTPRRPRLTAAFRSYSNSRLSRSSNSNNNSSTSASSSSTAVPASTSTSSLSPAAASIRSSLRPRSHTLATPAAPPVAVDQTPLSSSLPSGSSSSEGASSSSLAAGGSAAAADEEPCIRMSPFIDHSSATPALYFEPIERKGRAGSVIRLGRYTDKKELPKLEASLAPVVFKSKVVSRTHAELWVENGQWYVKDVKSSSGTFLNRIRLSPACTASQAFPIKDGDILQLGMDFRGGSEEVYKCVKMRVEINRSWQKRINNFNVSAHSRLRSLTQDSKPAAGQQQECSICLVAVAPCQSLFVAPCSHVWHYKCIRPIIVKAYPQFLCPNCRAVCDLEADVDVPELATVEDEEEGEEEEEVLVSASEELGQTVKDASDEEEMEDAQSGSEDASGSVESSGGAVEGQPKKLASDMEEVISRMNLNSVLTPANEAGPFVFDNMIVEESTNGSRV